MISWNAYTCQQDDKCHLFGTRDTRMKLTLKADLNPFLKPMLSKPLQDGINKIADFLAAVQYETLAEKYSD
ncbi:hypothetical protein FACS1894123_09650 [Bacteroidia bacterium]|nr:hypothetical protein FACS1894123_09650 [Bacteroidia bacterium]